MKTEYKRNLKTTYLILEADVLYQEDYQMRMMQENHIEGLLGLRGNGLDEKSRYHYNISGKVSMKAMYERAKIRHKDMEQFIQRLIEAVSAIRSHLLNMNCILLDPEYIFYEKGQFYFCYYPLCEGELCEAFHKLSEYFVSQADYEDREGIFMAYELHKITMEENYSLEQVRMRLAEVLRECEEEESEEEDDIEYIEEQIDWIGEREMGAGAMKEQKGAWNPVRGFLNRKKKAKWGEWDSISMEEET